MTRKPLDTSYLGNRAGWDERVANHLGTPEYDLAPLEAGTAELHPIEAAEIGPVDGKTILHLQCHFGRDSLILAQKGARVTGLDFSGAAIATARDLTRRLGLDDLADFVESDIYAAREALPRPAGFDMVFITWGTIGWLPDIAEWARIIAWYLKPGGVLYFAEGHPAALVFDDETAKDGMPGWFLPYFFDGTYSDTAPVDYAGDNPPLSHPTFEWMHTLSDVMTALLNAGLVIETFHEHRSVPWRMFETLKKDAAGMYHWPDTVWLPLSYSIRAVKA